MEDIGIIVIIVISIVIFLYIILGSTHTDESEEAFKKVKREKDLSYEEETDLLVMKRAGMSEAEMRDHIQKKRNSDCESEYVTSKDDSFIFSLLESWGKATGNTELEIVQEEAESQKKTLLERMSDDKNGTEKIHQNYPLAIGRRMEGNALRIFWVWGEGSNYRLMGFRDTEGHHHEPYDPNKNGRQIIDTAEQSGHTIDHPDGDGPFYYTFYLISESRHGSKNTESFQNPDNLLDSLLEKAQEQLAKRGLVRFSVDLSESHQPSSPMSEGDQLRAEFQEIIRSFGTKTRAIEKLRELRNKEKGRVRAMYESGEISQGEMEELEEMIEDEYDSARLRIKEDF